MGFGGSRWGLEVMEIEGIFRVDKDFLVGEEWIIVCYDLYIYFGNGRIWSGLRLDYVIAVCLVMVEVFGIVWLKLIWVGGCIYRV